MSSSRIETRIVLEINNQLEMEGAQPVKDADLLGSSVDLTLLLEACKFGMSRVLSYGVSADLAMTLSQFICRSSIILAATAATGDSTPNDARGFLKDLQEFLRHH